MLESLGQRIVVSFVHDVTTVLRTCVPHSRTVHGKFLLHEGMKRNKKSLSGKKKKGLITSKRRSPGLM